MAAVDDARFLIREIFRSFQTCEDVFALVGLLYAGKIVIKTSWLLLKAFRTHVISKIGPTPDFGRRFGKWAVVTGCTDGLGKAFAQELAKRGMNIILLSRNLDKLKATAEEIEQSYGVETFIVQADFNGGQPIYSKIFEEIQDKEIGLLVNNVGVMLEYPMVFEDVTEKDIWEHIHVNVGAMTMMTHSVLPQMVKRGRGAVINISSSSALKPLPLMTVYSATKAYVDFFSRALCYEYSGKGILVQTLTPFYISTAMTKFSSDLQKPGIIVPSPQKYVQNAITTLGYSNYTAGYWLHCIEYAICTAIPEWLWMASSTWLQNYLSRNYKVRKS